MKRTTLTSGLALLLTSSLILTACQNPTDQTDPQTDGTTPQNGQTQTDSPSETPGASDTEGSGGVELAAPGELPLVKEKTTLSVGLPKPASVEDVTTHWFTLWLEEKTNLDLEFVEYPTADAATKLEVEITSQQELPDVLWSFGLNDIVEYKYGAQGTIVDLLPYYESGSTYIRQVFEDPSNSYDIMDVMKAFDGKMYSVGRLQEELHVEYFHKNFINKTWLDTLNLEMPTTTDELYDVLVAFRDQDPNGNGEKDEIPLVGANNSPPDLHLMNAFIYNGGGDRLNVNDDGQLIAAYTQPEWREGLRYMHKLVDEGLLHPLSFTQDRAQLVQMTQNPDTMITGMVIASGIGGMFTDRVRDYTTMAPIEGPEGVQYTRFAPSFPTKQGQVTRYAEHPELAFRLLDYMWDKEASENQRWGEPGVDWVKPDEDDVALTANIGFEPYRKFTEDGANAGTSPIQNKFYNFWPPMALRYEQVNGLVDGGEDDYQRLIWAHLDLYMNKRPEKVVTKIFYTPEQVDEVADIKNSINTYVQESISRFAVGDLSIEDDWDNYIREIEAMGLEHFLEVSQTAYDAKTIDVGYMNVD